MNLPKDIAFGGISDYFPEEIRPGVLELERRLERFVNTLTFQLRGQPTLFTNAVNDTPEGTKQGDVWLRPDKTWWLYDGTAWI